MEQIKKLVKGPSLRSGFWLILALLLLALAGCSTVSGGSSSNVSETTMEATPVNTLPPSTPTRTFTSIPPTATLTSTPSPTVTNTITPTVTNTPTPSETPTETQPPPTPSGDDAIHIFGILDQSDNPKECKFIAVRINTGAWRTGDVAKDVKLALKRLFVKRQWFGTLYNPAYLSNINVESVSFKPGSGTVSIRLAGTYVRSGDRCDDSGVRAQVWTTIRQFPEVRDIDILLNGNLLGDILATGR